MKKVNKWWEKALTKFDQERGRNVRFEINERMMVKKIRLVF